MYKPVVVRSVEARTARARGLERESDRAYETWMSLRESNINGVLDSVVEVAAKVLDIYQNELCRPVEVAAPDMDALDPNLIEV